MTTNNRQLALFILRISLGGFLLLWGVDKIVNPEGTVGIFQNFYLLKIGVDIAFTIGIAEIILSLALIVGLWKRWTYGLGLILHAISTLSTWSQLIHPYTSINHLFLAGLPVLAAFIALYLMRDEDTMWSL